MTPDLRGFGESDSSEGPATMNRMAEDVAALMDQLAIEQAAIGGLSMGGYVALAFVKNVSVTREGVGSRGHARKADTEEGEANAPSTSGEGIVGRNGRHRRRDVAEVVDAGHGEQTTRTGETRSRHDVEDEPGGAAAALLGMAERDDLTEFISTIRVPTLILVGREDAITPVADSEKMQSQIDGSRLVVIENAGHVSNLEQTEQFNDALLGFLSTV